jgi:hypothetical protein
VVVVAGCQKFMQLLLFFAFSWQGGFTAFSLSLTLSLNRFSSTTLLMNARELNSYFVIFIFLQRQH